MNTNELNDGLEDIFGAMNLPERPRTEREVPAFAVAAERRFFEPCRKCGGSGRFRNFGQCFACKGKGRLEFKSSTEDRARARDQRVAREERRTVETIEAWQASNPAEHAWMTQAAPRFDFAAKMLETIAKFGSLTEGQMSAVRRCMARDAERATQRTARVEAAPAVDISSIERAFDRARESAARPGMLGVWDRPLRLTANEVSIRVRPGSAGSQWAEMLFVKSEDGRKLGHVKGGKFIARRECSDAEKAAVIAACSNPEQAAVAYGKAWSRCSVCGKTLTNDVSIEAAMGPICRGRFGW